MSCFQGFNVVFYIVEEDLISSNRLTEIEARGFTESQTSPFTRRGLGRKWERINISRIFIHYERQS